jgi:hypothetical protein
MRPLTYLVLTDLKNRALELLHKPAKLVVALLIVVAIVGTMILSFVGSSPEANGNPVWLKASVFAFIVFYLVIMLKSGLSSGSTIFDMSDVNLLFVSPISSRRALAYGIARMIRTALLMSIFILFQASTFRNLFGLDYGAVVITLGVFMLSVIFLSALALVVYATTNSRPRRQLAVRLAAVAIFVPAAIDLVMTLVQTRPLGRAIETFVASPSLAWTPIAGWTGQAAYAWSTGQLGQGLLFTALLVAATGLLLGYFAWANPDYYEDVLVATQTAFERKRAVAEGQVQTEAFSTKTIKVARTGVGGQGASAVFSKHLRESFRANRMALWGPLSFVQVGMGAGIALLGRGEGAASEVLIGVMASLAFLQLLTITMGRGLKELYSPYIYLIPAPSLAKILWSNVEIVFKVFVETLVTFVAAGLILGANPIIIALCVAVFTAYAGLLLGLNYLSLRWTDINLTGGFAILIYLLTVGIALAPGLVAAVLAGAAVGGLAGTSLGLVVMTVWELLVALGCFAASQGALDNTDMPTVKNA